MEYLVISSRDIHAVPNLRASGVKAYPLLIPSGLGRLTIRADGDNLTIMDRMQLWSRPTGAMVGGLQLEGAKTYYHCAMKRLKCSYMLELAHIA